MDVKVTSATWTDVGFKKRMNDILGHKMRAVIAKELLRIGKEIRDSIATKAARSMSPTWQQKNYFDVGDSILGGVAKSKVVVSTSDSTSGEGKFKTTYKNSSVAVNVVDFATLASSATSEEGFEYWRLFFAVGEHKRRSARAFSQTSSLGNGFTNKGVAPILVFQEVLQAKKRAIKKRIERKVKSHLRMNDI